MIKSRIAVALIGAAVFALVPAIAFAGTSDRSVSLNPKTHAIDQPRDYLFSNGLHFAAPAKAGINAKTVAATNVWTVPADAGGNFYVTSIKVETTLATSVSGGAAVTVGSTGTSATSIVASTSLSSAPAVGGCEVLPPKATAVSIAPGDTITFSVGTGATATAQTLKIHVSGFYH